MVKAIALQDNNLSSIQSECDIFPLEFDFCGFFFCSIPAWETMKCAALFNIDGL